MAGGMGYNEHMTTNYLALFEAMDVERVRDELADYYEGPELTDEEIRKGIANYADIDGLADILNAIEKGEWPA